MMSRLRVITCIAVLLAPSTAAHATTSWFFSTAAHGVNTEYSGTQSRDALTGWGMSVTADYFETAGFTFGYNTRAVTGDAASTVDEEHSYASVRINHFVDALNGRLSVRLDRHRIEDETASLHDSGAASGIRVAFLNRASTRYVDVGYMRSRYASDNPFIDDIIVRQYTPTLGFAPGTRDWTQIRAYLISHSESNRMPNVDDRRALELKWSRRFIVRDERGLDQITLAGLIGERIYAIDPDTADVFSVSDLQRSAVSLALKWRWSADTHIVIASGRQNYENVETSDRYTGTFFYLNGIMHW